MAGAALPEALLQSLHRAAGFDEQAFIAIHASGEQVVSVRINPAKIPEMPAACVPVPWCRFGYYLPDRPSFIADPLWHAGAYYVQEASSMFVEQCFTQFFDLTKQLTVLDLCAAPGGKSTLIQSLLSPGSTLVSNELVPARAGVLVENLTRWGGANTIVTNNQPEDFGRLPHLFDAILVDAPCSGSGLFRRDAAAVNEWSLAAVATCSRRQKKILAEVYPALKPGGMLVYSTCSYSVEENEEICDWLCEQYDLTPLQLQTGEWGIVESGNSSKAHGYRFFPYRLKGEGFFLACFRKNSEEERTSKNTKRSRLAPLPRREKGQVTPWLKRAGELCLYHLGKEVFLWPQAVDKTMLQINANLYTKKAGVHTGRLMGDGMVPAHELALSEWVSDELLTISLKKEEALQYLRRDEVTLATGSRGWALVRYGGLNLGWVKILPNRVNNYYPREWRILKSEFD